ncbi:MAG: hypothetical protein SF070_11385 [Gemmatimonadota bacterium]|nr:hypothetical protein [Gemmatimonadota bacterium]
MIRSLKGSTAILVLGLLACQDESPTAQREITGTSLEPSNVDAIEPRPLQAFVVSLNASGAFRPGEPISFAIDVANSIDVKQGKVTLILPEVEAARRQGWKLDSVPRGVALPAAGAWAHAGDAGSSVRYTANLVIPVPGYYRAIASANASVGLRDETTGRTVNNHAHAEVWFLVTDSGGGVTAGFDDRLLPDTAFPGAGPFRSSKGIHSAAKALPAGARAGLRGNVSAAATITVDHVYFDHIFQWYSAVGRSTVSWTGAATGSTRADPYGYSTLPCAANGTLNVNIRADNDSIRVRYGSSTGSDTLVKFVAVNVPCGATISITSTNDTMPMLFDHMNQARYWSRTVFGRGRAKLLIVRTAPGGAPSYTSGDVVNYPADAVFGDYGVYGTAHEFGHAFHYSLGSYDITLGCTPHYLDSLYTLGCAWNEGFADFHAAVTRPDRFPWYQDTTFAAALERNDYYHGGDGARGEAPVAAFLLDLTDSSIAQQPDDDAVKYPGSYIASVVQTCQVKNPGSSTWLFSKGIDHLVYCLEKQIDPAVTGSPTYFVTRSPDPSTYRESATEPGTWNRNAIRALWLLNLYGQ